GQQVTHMHVDSIKACTVESCRHFNMRVHALLTQYGNFRTCASGNIRCCHIFVDIERQFYIQARIGVVRFRLMLLIGTLRVVTQALHLPGSFCPPDTQRGAAFAEYSLPVGGNYKTEIGRASCRERVEIALSGEDSESVTRGTTEGFRRTCSRHRTNNGVT